MIEEIDRLKAELDAFRPLKPEKLEALKSVLQAEETEYIFESNAIEGNTLTLAETKIVLRQGLKVPGKPLRDHLEATNHLKAFAKLQALTREQTPLNERTLLELHDLVLRGINEQYAVCYRDVAVRISG